MRITKAHGLACAIVLLSCVDARADFFVDFDGRAPSPPFTFKNELLWDSPEMGLATMRSNQAGRPTQIETTLGESAVPDTWDPSLPGSYEVSCKVVNHTVGHGAGSLDFFYATGDYSWTVTWTTSSVSLDIQFEQIENLGTQGSYSYLLDTTDDFHTYRVDWDPSVPSATLFVDGEDTGITLPSFLLSNSSRGQTKLNLGDSFGGAVGGEIVFDYYRFESRPGPSFEMCNDDEDNDLDGDIDCADDDCVGDVVCLPEGLCGDGEDNDKDGDTDCNDADCVDAAVCQPEGDGGDGDCNDGQDNDQDGDVDCTDSDCRGFPECDNLPSFFVDFDGSPSPPFLFHHEFLWDTPSEGLATMLTNQGGQPAQMETILDPSAPPGTWDPSLPGSYEVSCRVVNHTSGLGAGALDFFYADEDYSWTVTWTTSSVSLDIQFNQIETFGTEGPYSFPLDTTDDFHTYRVDWSPSVPSATLFVDGEATGISLDVFLLSNSSRGRTNLVLGDSYGGTVGGEIVFDYYSFVGEPPVEFKRGDVEQDGVLTVTDALNNVSHQFLGLDVLCRSSLDANDDGEIDIVDPMVTLSLLFFPSVEALLPPYRDCGVDPTTDDLDCQSYPGDVCP